MSGHRAVRLALGGLAVAHVVEAMVLRRQVDGAASRPIPPSWPLNEATRSSATSSTRSFWYAVRRTRSLPCASTMSASSVRVVPLIRPATGATPT